MSTLNTADNTAFSKDLIMINLFNLEDHANVCLDVVMQP